MIITSPQNPIVKLTKQLLNSSRQRKKNALTVVEGTHLIDASLKSGHLINHVLVAESAVEIREVAELITRLQDNQTNIFIIEDKLYQDIRTLGTGIDIMAVLPIAEPQLPEINSQDCLILNDVQDSGNVGTLLRTAAAVGITNIICTSATAQAWSPKTLRAGMGAQFSLNIYENVSIEAILANITVPMFATSSHTETVLYQLNLSEPVAWVMGHEGQGVCDEIMNHAQAITIPQPNGQESLNVAIAGALCMYEGIRQRCFA